MKIYTDEKIDLIIIYGFELTNNKLNKEFKYRLDKALNWIKKYGETNILITGGKKIAIGKVTEAQKGKDYLQNKNPFLKIEIETSSSDTLENTINIKKYIFKEKNYLLISSPNHLFRCICLFEKLYKVDPFVIDNLISPSDSEKRQLKYDLLRLKNLKNNI